MFHSLLIFVRYNKENEVKEGKHMEQRKILILTGNFGMGHRCVAEAIRQQLAAMHTHAQIQVLDLMDALFPNSSALLYRGFAQMVHHCPSLYNQLNRITGRCSTLPMQSWIADKMKELLKDAEIVVSTFPLCAQFAAMYKRKYHASIALYTYITDIGAQDEWIVPDTDLYFVGAQETKLDLLYKGVAPHSIHVGGIPVRQDFLHPMRQAHSGKTEILLMGGVFVQQLGDDLVLIAGLAEVVDGHILRQALRHLRRTVAEGIQPGRREVERGVLGREGPHQQVHQHHRRAHGQSEQVRHPE